jgi:hypothetical protein
VARELGITGRVAAVPALFFAESMTTRRRVARLDALFQRFRLRGKAAIHWLGDPEGPVSGLLIFSGVSGPSVSKTASSRIRRSAGRPRSRDKASAAPSADSSC